MISSISIVSTDVILDLVVVSGIAVVLPLALGGSLRWWLGAAASTAVALALPTGWPAAAVVLPFLAVAIGHALRAAGAAGPLLFWTLDTGAGVVAAAHAVVAAAALVQSRAGIVLFDVHEPIVQLTCVHFLYAGCGSLVLARRMSVDPRHGLLCTGVFAVALTAVAPTIVALGFVTRLGVLQVGGAVLLTVGVLLAAVLELRTSFHERRATPRWLLRISGIAPWVPMVLAVAWAAAQHWPVPALSVPDMVRTHGMLNGLGFVLCGLLATRNGPADAPAAVATDASSDQVPA